LYANLISPMRATYTVHLLLLDLTIPIIFGEGYKLCSSSSCCFLKPPVTSSLLGPYIHLSTLFVNALRLCSSVNKRPRFTSIKNNR
jgi:hypothetical protein